MGIEKTTIVLSGIKTNDKELKELGFDGKFDDTFLPLIEGHIGTKIDMFYGEGSEDVFIGAVAASSDYYDHMATKLVFIDFKKVSDDLNNFGFNTKEEDLDNWFFDVYS